MKGKLNDRDAECPFFRAHTADSVVCEDLIPDSTATLHFNGRKGKHIQYSVFCCHHYRNCERYLALQKKYEEEEAEARGLSYGETG